MMMPTYDPIFAAMSSLPIVKLSIKYYSIAIMNGPVFVISVNQLNGIFFMAIELNKKMTVPVTVLTAMYFLKFFGTTNWSFLPVESIIIVETSIKMQPRARVNSYRSMPFGAFSRYLPIVVMQVKRACVRFTSKNSVQIYIYLLCLLC